MSNEEWIVAQAKSCLKTDIYAAKSWLITAKTLFPRNFSLQFEAYIIEKNCKNIQQSAKLLENMIRLFESEGVLWKELETMCESLQAEAKDEKTSFLADIFSALRSELQSAVLVRMAETRQDPIQQLRLYLLVLTRQPDQVQHHGVKLIEKLLNNEKQLQMTSPVNCYRKYLVCDVLPLVLKSDQLQVQSKQLIRWLQKSIEFYVCYITQSPQTKTDTPLSPGPELSMRKFPGFSAPTNKWRVSIPGLSDKESVVERPMHKLSEILSLVARHLSWDIRDFTQLPSEKQLARCEEFKQMAASLGAGDPTWKQVLYCAIILFFTTAFRYACAMMPAEFAATSSGNQNPNAVLIEGPVDEPGYGKFESEVSQRIAVVTASKKLSLAKDIKSQFVVAYECWTFLQDTEYVSKDFLKLLQHWKSDNWIWLKRFEVDIAIYRGQFNEASKKINALMSVIPKSIALDVQLACCDYATENRAGVVRDVLKMVKALSSQHGGGWGEEEGEEDQVTVDARHQTAGSDGETKRNIQLRLCTEPEVIPYAMHTLINIYKREVLSARATDQQLGNMLVLIQYDWPVYQHYMDMVFSKILAKQSFTYNLFFNYIIVIDILEEIGFLKKGAEVKVTLDILPQSTKAIAQSRTVTRGVQKGVIEDFKVHLEKQVQRCYENPNNMVRAFLMEEGQMLLNSL